MKPVLVICIFFFSYLGFSQEYEPVIQQRIEYWLERNDKEATDLTSITDIWDFYLENQLDLNQATKEQLLSLELLNEIQINELLKHIEEHGKLITIYELQTLSSWDMQSIERVVPFVKVDEKVTNFQFSWQNALRDGKFEWISRVDPLIDKPVGYSDSLVGNSTKGYLGKPIGSYTRLRYQYGTNLSLGIIASNDPGEVYFNTPNKKGFDFYSVHAFYKGGKYIKAIALGDYHIQIGQGLNFWTNYAFGKSADIGTLIRNPIGLKPNVSADENRFLRGGAIDFGYKNWHLLVFTSHKNRDGNIEFDSLQNRSIITSIDVTGFHRTVSENEKRNQFSENIQGVNLGYKIRNFEIGSALVNQLYSVDYNPDVKPYNQFDFRGNHQLTGSIDYKYLVRNLILYGEVSQSFINRKIALVQGLGVAFNQFVSMNLFYRKFDTGYYTFYNSGVSEGTNLSNEEGFYYGMTISPNRKWQIQGYMDLFQFPWLRFQADAPSKGQEYLGQITWSPTKVSQVYLRYRHINKQANSSNSESISTLENQVQNNLRLHAQIQLNEAFQIRSRVELVQWRSPSENIQNGTLIQQDLIYKTLQTPLDITLRYAVFQTDSWNSRVYSYESNPLYVYGNQVYYDKGSRYYILLHYNLNRMWDFWVKFGDLIYTDKITIGSGSQLIKGNQQREITFQMRMQIR
jgi:hypothetical protein